MAAEKSVEKEPYRVIPLEMYSIVEEEVTLCEAMVAGTGTLLILIANKGNKIIKVPSNEELEYTLLLSNINLVESAEGKVRKHRGAEVKEKTYKPT